MDRILARVASLVLCAVLLAGSAGAGQYLNPDGSTSSGFVPEINHLPAFTPTNPGQVSLSGTPSFSLSGTPSVNVANTPSVSVTGTPSVSVTGTPSVTVTGTPSVSVSNSPAVTISGTPTVGLTGAVPAGENFIGTIGGVTARPVVSFTRPANTTAYASGSLVANSTTAASVTPLQWTVSRATGKGGMVRRVRVRKTGTTITNASFRIHLYTASPAASNGDGGAWLTNQAINYVGSLDVTLDKAFTDGAAGNGTPSVGSEINFTSDTYYGLVEARAAYVPASAETFTIELELQQN